MKATIDFPFLRALDDAGGSEHGWALNIAKLFIKLGHDVRVGVSCLEEGPFPDLMYLPERFDLAENKVIWEAYKGKSARILMGVFNPLTAGMTDSVPDNMTLITPYRSCGTRCLVVPYAYYESRPVPGFERKTIGWTVRNPFHYQGQISPTVYTHLLHLKACKKLAEQGAGLIVFSSYTYPENWCEFPPIIQEAHQILQEFRETGFIFSDHLNYDDYLNLLSKTSVVLPLDGLGSLTEALKIGSVPLSWISPVNIYENFSEVRDYCGISFDQIYGKLSRLLNEEDFYASEYNSLLEKSAVYSLDQALAMAQAALDAALR